MYNSIERTFIVLAASAKDDEWLRNVLPIASVAMIAL